MVFQGAGRRGEMPFLLEHQSIAHAKSYKYLGTIITDTGNFKLNEVNLKKKGLRASFIISKNIGAIAYDAHSLIIGESLMLRPLFKVKSTESFKSSFQAGFLMKITSKSDV